MLKILDNVLLVGAFLGFTLLYALPDDARLGSIQADSLSFMLFVASLIGISFRIGKRAEGQVGKYSQAEQQSWVQLAFNLAVLSYLVVVVVQAGVHAQLSDPAIQSMGRHVFMMILVMSVASGVIAHREEGAPEADERDQTIASRASSYGYGVLATAVLVLVGSLGITPPELLWFASPLNIAHALLGSFLLSCTVQSAATSVLYLRDRQ